MVTTVTIATVNKRVLFKSHDRALWKEDRWGEGTVVMSTKICKWSREKGFPKDFADPTRRSHVDPTLILSEEQEKNIRRKAGVQGNEKRQWNGMKFVMYLLALIFS